MGLFNKMFGERATQRRREGGPHEARDSEQFEQAGPGDSGSGRRRELIHVVLRDTMRDHGVPSDWMTATVLKVSQGSRAGLHVQLLVRREHEQLLAHVPAFQEGFVATLRGFDARALEWMKSVSWVFEGTASAAGSPRPALRVESPTPPVPASGDDSDLQQDLKALFAIRDQALQDASDDDHPRDFQPTQPMR